MWKLIILITCFGYGDFRSRSRPTYLDVEINYVMPEDDLMNFTMAGPLLCAKFCLARPQCLAIHHNLDDRFCVLHFSNESIVTFYQRVTHVKSSWDSNSTVYQGVMNVNSSWDSNSTVHQGVMNVNSSRDSNSTVHQGVMNVNSSRDSNSTVHQGVMNVNSSNSTVHQGVMNVNSSRDSNSTVHQGVMNVNSSRDSNSTVHQGVMNVNSSWDSNSTDYRNLDKYGYVYQEREDLSQLKTASVACSDRNTSGCPLRSACMPLTGNSVYCFNLACNQDPPKVVGAEVINRGYEIGSNASYKCSTRYVPFDNEPMKVECQDNTIWTRPRFSCIYTCLEPASRTFHSYQAWMDKYGGRRVGNKRRMRCFTYTYYSTGSIWRACLANGEWEPITLRCTGCRLPPNLAYATKTGRGYRVNTTWTYHCIDGYAPKNSSIVPTRTCQMDNKWGPVTTTCIIFGCGPPPKITQGQVQSGSTDFGDMRYYTCTPGYPSEAPGGKPYVVCNNATEKWDPVVSPCRGCGYPPALAYAVTDPGTTDHNDVRTYTCKLGYMSNAQDGKPSRTCLTTWKWSSVRKPCYHVCPGYVIKKAKRFCYGYKANLNWKSSNDTCESDHSGRARLFRLDRADKFAELLVKLPTGRKYYIADTPSFSSENLFFYPNYSAIYSTTVEQTTSTAEPTTTEIATTEPMTTNISTFEQTTTNMSNAEQTTTNISTFEQTTTNISTTEQTTTNISTAEQTTTNISTAEQTTTNISTVEQTTTETSTAEQTTTETSTAEQTTTETSTAEQTTTETSTAEQTTTETSTAEQTTTETSTAEQTTTETSTAEKTTTSTVDLGTTNISTVEQTTTNISTTEQATTNISTVEQTTINVSTTEQTTTEMTTFEQTTRIITWCPVLFRIDDALIYDYVDCELRYHALCEVLF